MQPFARWDGGGKKKKAIWYLFVMAAGIFLTFILDCHAKFGWGIDNGIYCFVFTCMYIDLEQITESTLEVKYYFNT